MSEWMDIINFAEGALCGILLGVIIGIFACLWKVGRDNARYQSLMESYFHQMNAFRDSIDNLKCTVEGYSSDK